MPLRRYGSTEDSIVRRIGCVFGLLFFSTVAVDYLAVFSEKDQSVYVDQRLEQSMNPFFNKEHHSFIWCCQTGMLQHCVT